jgi:hypothetical protein
LSIPRDLIAAPVHPRCYVTILTLGGLKEIDERILERHQRQSVRPSRHFHGPRRYEHRQLIECAATLVEHRRCRNEVNHCISKDFPCQPK